MCGDLLDGDLLCGDLPECRLMWLVYSDLRNVFSPQYSH